MPVLSAVATSATAPEGGVLHWTIRLSAPTTGAVYGFTAKAPGGPELDSTDVTPDWLGQWVFPVPTGPVPLSGLAGFLGPGVTAVVFFDPGATEASFDIPIAADGAAEPAESVRFELAPLFAGDPTIPAAGLALTGTVPAG